MTEITNPFDGEVSNLVEQRSISEQLARDVVVYRYLKLGDTRALAHWLKFDYNPTKKVKELLSYMLQPEQVALDDPEKTIVSSLEEIPYELKPKRRDGKRGAPRNPVADERNRIIKENYKRLMENFGKGAHESAIAELVEQLGPAVSENAVREALKNRSPKSGD